MQQAIYNPLHLQNTRATVGTTAPRSAVASRSGNVLRWVARKWDLVGVVALMGSSAAYGVYALAHLGL